MANIFIKAYTALNLGDDLFVKMLCERYPEHDFKMITTTNSGKAFRTIKNLTIINRSFISRVTDKVSRTLGGSSFVAHKQNINLIKASDLVVYIGGSIFMETANWHSQWKQLNREIEASQRYFTIGCNFGPFTSIDFLEKHRMSFSKMKDICFRDTTSYNLFSDLDTARLSTDVVLGMPAIAKDSPPSNNVIISILNLENRDELSMHMMNYESKMADIARALIEKGKTITFMSFCKAQGDVVAAERIISYLDSDSRSKVDIYSYAGNLDESLSIIKESFGVVAVRFHSMILGWIYNRPVYPLVYSIKTSNLLDDSEYSGPYTDLRRVEHLDAEKVVNHLLESEGHNIDKHRSLAKTQFQALDRYLQEHYKDDNI